MDIRQLRCFISVAEHLNFTEAAKRLFVTQSAVSYQISELEQQLNLKLFIRDKHSVRLTAAGKVLQEEACGIIAKVNEAVNRARLAESGIEGKLNIGLVLSGEKKFLSQVLKNFRCNYPNIDLNITRIPLQSPSEALSSNLDVGFTLILGQDIPSEVSYHLLYSDVASVVVPLDHRWANETSLDLSALNHEPVVTLTRETAPAGMNWLMQTCSKQGFVPNIVRHVSDFETLLLLIETGLGVSVLTRSYVQQYPNFKLHCVELDCEDAVVHIIVFWKKRWENPAVPIFLQQLGVVI